ncbi:DnaD domain-containing protein [[Clostridium] colinum]|uniref:DnaD domain-containing protein n=1 Tax=[Clostridium] colinum TaxID=36835 RepID=UPI002023FE02|nr:DnaD domain protein [[Clostridium] colinum]
MAERRMFAKSIIDSDSFIDMPTSSRLLYYDLSMRADDDGFVNSPKKIMRMTGASDDDLKLLVAKKFLIPFESGVVVIKHWKIHNYIRNDRYKETIHLEEKALLSTTENKEYTLDTVGIPDDIPLGDAGKVRLGKGSIGKDSGSIVEYDNHHHNPKSYVQKYMKVFPTCSSLEIEKLISYEDDGMEDGVICMAIDEAINNNVRKLKYITVILDNWLSNNIKTVIQLEAYKKERSKQNESSNKGQATSNTTTNQSTNYEELRELTLHGTTRY